MIQRGAPPPASPTHPGEAATLVIALRRQPDFRPAGWQDQVVKWWKVGLDGDLPYLSERILDLLPEPIPQAILDDLPRALAHTDVDLQIAACKQAEKHPHVRLREPLKKVVETLRKSTS